MADMTLEEALAAATVDEELVTPVNEVLLINPETRTINVPDSEKLFGARQDMDVERKYFKCPRIVGDNIDLSEHRIFINYVPSKQDGTYDLKEDVQGYWCKDLAVEGDFVTFSWKLSENVTRNAGYIAFAVYAKTIDEYGNLQTKWHTTIAIGNVLDTLPDGEEWVTVYPDIVMQLLERMDEVEKIATEEAMQGYVDDYFNRNPMMIDRELKDETKAAPADIVGKLSEDIAYLKGNGTGTGLSDDLRTALKTYFTNMQTLLPQLAYATEKNIGNTLISNAQEVVTALDSSGGSTEPDTPVEPDVPEVTLTSISATYTGGEVATGTALSYLTGITVTATYSDGSIANVTGYTLSGTIAEGNNTITVSYGGKTTTFAVVGVVESGGDNSESEDLGVLVYNVDIDSVTTLSNNILTGNIEVINGEIVANGASAKLKIGNNVPTLANKTIVVEFGECERQGTAHGRLLLWNSGNEGVIYRSTGFWGVYTNGQWVMTENSEANIISNNTMKMYVNETKDRVKVTVGDELLIETDITISVDNQILMFGNSNAYYNAIVKSIKMYEGEV